LDGGTFIKRTDVVKKKKVKKKVNFYTIHGQNYFICALTGNPLSSPVVADAKGNLFNKEAFLQEWIIKKKEIKERFPHIKKPLV
jgi:hypothetical protein